MSAPTTLQGLLQRNMPLVSVRLPQLMGFDQAPAVELAGEHAGQLMQLRAQLSGIGARIVEQDVYRIGCGRQVESMRDSINTAPDRDESENYMTHLATLLARDERLLAEAIADTERLLRVQAELNTRVDAAFGPV